MYELVYTEIYLILVWLLCVLGTTVVVSAAPEADCVVTVTAFHTCTVYLVPMCINRVFYESPNVSTNSL